MTWQEQFSRALSVEWMKFRRAPVALVTSALLLGGILLICGALLYGVQSGDSQLIAKAGPLAAQGGWTGLFAIANQVLSIAGMLAFGVVIGWVFGREFTDGTIVGLFARPVPRSAIAIAKLTVSVAWVAALSVSITVLVIAAGFALGVGPAESAIVWHALKLAAVGILTGLLALVAALAATWGRGYLSAIGTIVGVVVLSVVASLFGIGGWFTFAAPGIWAVMPSTGVPDAVLVLQLVLVAPVTALIVAATVGTWIRLRV